MRAASARASSISYAAGTTFDTRPQSSAVARIDRVAGEDKFGGAGHADDARQDPRPAVAGHQPDLQECRAEDRGVGGDAHVGKTGDIVAEADRRTVDGGDQRHLDAPDRAHDAMNAVAIALADMHARAGEHAGAFAHRLDIAAGRERGTGAGQDGAAHLAVGVDARRGVREQFAVAVLAQRIARLGAVDRQRDDVAGLLEQQRAHAALSLSSMREALQMMIDAAVKRVDHGEALEIVADIQFVGHAHAAVHLHRALADEAAGLADLHLCGGGGLASLATSLSSSLSVTISVIETDCS